MWRVISVVGVVIAVLALVVALLRLPSQGSVTESDELIRLKVQVAQLSQRITDIEKGLADLSTDLVPVHRPVEKINKNPSSEEPTSKLNNTNDDNSALRRLVQEEIKNYFNKYVKKYVKSGTKFYSPTTKPEDWEKQEFGYYAEWIHYVGEKVGMDPQQKREYYRLLKDYYEKSSKLRERIWKEMADKTRRERWRRYSRENRELLKQVRSQILQILTPEQQKKYRELFQDDIWPD